jgi:alcohol dehydrogenase
LPSDRPSERLRDLIVNCDRIAAYVRGLSEDDSRIDEIAAKAVVDPTAGGNPIPLTEDAARAIFRAALKG